MDTIDYAKLVVHEAEKDHIISDDYKNSCLQFLESADISCPTDVIQLQEILETIAMNSDKDNLVTAILESAKNDMITENEKDLLLSLIG